MTEATDSLRMLAQLCLRETSTRLKRLRYFSVNDEFGECMLRLKGQLILACYMVYTITQLSWCNERSETLIVNCLIAKNHSLCDYEYLNVFQVNVHDV